MLEMGVSSRHCLLRWKRSGDGRKMSGFVWVGGVWIKTRSKRSRHRELGLEIVPTDTGRLYSICQLSR